ncbi:lytic transglycosylase domain-containing protein [Belnapia sp. T6]|uniref:Lytic transglycosylase domain-containing protein n=1 Tax=Belnapia mucosa TaxID=2804532 RepID=A0ABS1V2I7_9PROT|nr:lytic transglycosylase domain-containing protein [Belnapia mucosa]MBL6454894.1 lytic transglycosylase domain-containing protein [Belnapia mucosa]
MRLPLLLLLLGLLPLLLPLAAAAQEDHWTACRRAITAAEHGSGLPPGLLLAIALVETGRGDPRSGRFEPWPWSWNTGGEGHAEPSKEAALAAVRAAQEGGRRSIDIGCMQVNLLHHPDAFPGLAEGFDPATNIRYAIGFLKALRAQTGNWADAIAQYHSADPERGAGYQRRVVLARLGTAWAAGGAVPLAARSLVGLCAAGRQPSLVIRRGGGAARPRLACSGAVRRATGSARAPG